MDPSSLILLPSVGIVALVILTLVLGAVRGVGDEMGRAALAESAPWIARLIPSLAVRLIFFRSDADARQDLLDEIASIVEAVFKDRHTVSDRARGIFVVLAQTASLVRAGYYVRLYSLRVDRRGSRAVRVDHAVVSLVGSRNIDDLNLPRRIERGLLGAGLVVVGQLIEKSPQEIASIRGLNPKDFKTVRARVLSTHPRDDPIWQDGSRVYDGWR